MHFVVGFKESLLIINANSPGQILVSIAHVTLNYSYKDVSLKGMNVLFMAFLLEQI